MNTILVVIASAAAVAAVAFVGRAWLRNRLRWRGIRIVECPENHAPVAVRVDAAQAAAAALRGEHNVRLNQCSRWPEKAGCGQECLAAIEAAPEDCLAKTTIARWYEGTECAICGKAIESIDWQVHEPGVVHPDGRHLVRWKDVPMADLPTVLATHAPVCWDCVTVGWVAQQHPDWVTERPLHRSPGIQERVPPFGGV